MKNMKSMKKSIAFALASIVTTSFMALMLVPALSSAQGPTQAAQDDVFLDDTQQDSVSFPASGQDSVSNPKPQQDSVSNLPAGSGSSNTSGTQTNIKTTAAPASSVSGGLQNPLKGVNNLADLFYTIIKFVYSLSYAVIAVFLIISGFKFVAAQGSEDKLNDAKKTFYYTIIGAILLIGANVITEVIRNVINQFSVNKI